MLEEKITELKRELIGFATLVERMIEKSVKGLHEKKRESLVEVIEKDEPKTNALEISMDALCASMIAQFEPKAKDLRIALMVAKMSSDLERMGDHAVNIAESALFLTEKPLVKPLVDIPKMAEVTIKMLKDSISSFIEENSKLAKEVCERDNTVDELKDKILSELITLMSQDPSTIERSLHLLRISGNLERIADLSTNICEDVIYMTEGKVIKHQSKNW